MTEHQEEISEARLHFFERQEIALAHIPASGYILDIGGGGEGIIGQLEGERVIAIDVSERELAEAPAGPLKIVMDATDLHFLDDTFNVVTAFFTLMYIPNAEHTQVFAEMFRVLAPGGRCLLWDVACPPRTDPEKDILVLPLTVKLPKVEVTTGYGARWPEAGRGIEHYVTLAESVGFEVVAQSIQGHVITLALQKPQPETE
ncbi:MAG: class I SAM-dependent methyltransferase [Anaerolineales bacterium]